MSPFDIKAAGANIELNRKTRKGELSYTVTNESDEVIDGRALLKLVGDFDDETKQKILRWATIRDESERKFTANGAHQYVIDIEVPADEPPMSFTIRLDMVGVENPDGVYSEGQPVEIEIPQPPPEPEPIRKKWWIYVVIAVAVIAIGVGTWLVIRSLTMNKIGPKGGTVNAYSKEVRLVFPENAVAEKTKITVERIDGESIWPRAGLVPDYSYRFGPEALALDDDVDLILRYQDEDLPDGVSEGELVVVIAESRGGPWSEVSTTVDDDENTASTSLSEFGFAALAVRVRSVGMQPSSADPVIGESVQINATPRSAAGTSLNFRKTVWSSSNSSRATVSDSGLVNAVRRGGASIAAKSGGAQGTVSIAVKRYVYDAQVYIDKFRPLADFDGFKIIDSPYIRLAPARTSIAILPVRPEVRIDIRPELIEKIDLDMFEVVRPEIVLRTINEYRMKVGTDVGGKKESFIVNKNSTAGKSLGLQLSTKKYTGLSLNTDITISANGFEEDNPSGGDPNDDMGSASTTKDLSTDNQNSKTIPFTVANANYIFEGRVVATRRKE